MDALGPAPLPTLLATLYLVVGLVVAGQLHRGGHPATASVSALVAWPVLLPLTRARPAPVAATGPLAGRIMACLQALRRSLTDPATATLASGDELAGLERTLLAADARLGLVDRILDEARSDDPALTRSAERLSRARERSAAEIEAVLVELEQLRLHAAMLVLSGEASTLQDRVSRLVDRARAIEEVAAMDLGQARA